MSHYKYNKRWRLTHIRERNIERKRNYAQSRKTATNGKYRWTREELRLLHTSRKLKIPDRELARMLRRSVQAIQVQRVRRKKLKKRVLAHNE